MAPHPPPGTDRLPPPRRRGVGPPAVLLHGFTQTGDCLGPLADAVASDHEVLLVDLPGHGAAAAWHHLDCPGAADALAATVADALAATATDHRGDRPPLWFGYSMGARLALHVALRHPELVGALVLVGATAGIEDAAARAERRLVDEARGMRVEEIGVEAFVREWLAAPMFATLPDPARFERERAANTVEGLAGSLRHSGTGSMAPLWHDLDRIGALGIPVVVIAGALDAPYVVLGARLVESIGPTARLEVVEGAGHAVHLERPDAVGALLP